MRAVWLCAPNSPPLPGVASGLAQPRVLPFQPSRLCGGCLARLPLAQAQVQASSWPHTPPPPPPSWADRKIPDIVVQRWLQAGRQQEVGAREGGPEPPEHLEASGPDRPCSWRATCLHECLCVSRLSGFLVTHSPGLGQGQSYGGAGEGTGGVNFLAIKCHPSLGQN